MAKGSETGGCLNCYAARQAARNLPGLKSPTTGKHFARILDSGPRWTGDVELIESQLLLPLKWREPKRIFVDSMSDLFHEALPIIDIKSVFDVMREAYWHIYQILTKRAARMLEICRWLKENYDDVYPLPNVWAGTSVENQATAEERTGYLRHTPAAVRFISQEPQLSHINWTSEMLCGIDWLIQGGESGPEARSFDLDWARDTRDACRLAGVKYFFKQAGANVFDSNLTASGRSETVRYKDRKGGDWDEWPPELRVREFPLVGVPA